MIKLNLHKNSSMKSQYLFFFLCLMYTMPSYGENPEDVISYVNRYKDIAIAEMHRTGIPASIKLGQAILESNSGKSKLAKQSNNHFGIKCKKGWKGQKYYHEDDDYDKKGRLTKSCFRGYPDVESSYIDHSSFLMERDRYAFLFTYHPRDYKQWAYGLKSAGYATAKHYAQTVIGLIERYHLHQYDTHSSLKPAESTAITHTFDENEVLVVFGDAKNDGAEVLKKAEYIKQPEVAVKKPPVEEKVEEKEEEKIILFPPVQQKQPFVINTLQTIKIADSINRKTLAIVAKKHDISMKKLLKYNELNKGQLLIVGQYLFLSKKKKTYLEKKRTHTVLKGETMYSISQRYGIRLKSLLKRNRLKKGQEPLHGEVIALKGKKVKRAPKFRKW